jgi:hypothetical protein
MAYDRALQYFAGLLFLAPRYCLRACQSKITPNKAEIRDKLPLLCYSIDWWKNGVAGFSNLHHSFHVPFSLISDTFLPLAQRFLETKPTVTVWVESIWTFSKTPPLHLLAEQIAAWGYNVVYPRPKGIFKPYRESAAGG